MKIWERIKKNWDSAHKEGRINRTIARAEGMDKIEDSISKVAEPIAEGLGRLGPEHLITVPFKGAANGVKGAARVAVALPSIGIAGVKSVMTKGGLLAAAIAAPIALISFSNSIKSAQKANSDREMGSMGTDGASLDGALDNMPKVLDFSESAPSRTKQVLGPNTARYLGKSANGIDFSAPNTIGGDGASLIDGKPMKDLGGLPGFSPN